MHKELNKILLNVFNRILGKDIVSYNEKINVIELVLKQLEISLNK